MSILTKPYTIAVYDDRFEDNELKEYRLGVIGANDMDSPNRALEPVLSRNVNGVKKLTFKMYKRYTDTITGDQVENPFSEWLISERKVKLWYDGKWYDFIIKDINENSADYLYTYQLEDAIVQELSKNGFGVTLDAELMNNIGNAKELGQSVLNETGWIVDSEVFIQTVDESLVYLTTPSSVDGLKIYHIKDQVKPYTNGVTWELLTDSTTPKLSDLANKTILAFYSCCKNKPHRFQFIYSPNGYNVTNDIYAISRKDDRSIDEKDCQYYIDFDSPELNYVSATGTYTKDMNLFLPTGFGDGVPGIDDETRSSDSVLSAWYRGKRYGFSQQSVYVPLLEKYCQKFKREEEIPLIKDKNVFLHSSQTNATITSSDGAPSSDQGTLVGCIQATFSPSSSTSKISTINIKKKAPYVGLRLDLEHHECDTYVLKYQIEVNKGKLKTIGGHNACYEPLSYKVLNSSGVDLASGKSHTGSYVTIDSEGLTEGTYQVEIKYKKRESDNSQKDLYLQPNRDTDLYIDCKLSNIFLIMEGDYLGYTEAEFVSPTLVQNCINNYKFESTGGWTATTNTSQSSKEKAKVENVYGRFGDTTNEVEKYRDDTNEFITISEDFYSGKYSKNREYKPLMKMSFFNTSQFALNSGIRDNRSLISEMPKNEEWVLDYKIVNNVGTIVNTAFSFSLGEYIYNTDTGGYNERTGFISFATTAPSEADERGIPEGYARKIITVTNSSYTKETFKKDSKIYLKITPNSVTTSTLNGETIPQTWYIEGISLYRKTVDENGKIIIPDYEKEDSDAAAEYVKNGVLNHKYHYFNSVLVTGDDAITNPESLTTVVKNTLEYTAYKPVYNEGAEKIRTITAKESNYFNILQSIAETFEAWLIFDIDRDEDTGAINYKKVMFKNYSGIENYANFRYGVNLKDISRTYSSKNITTKLIVKQNNNELANEGFCTIQRAGANPTGENYIYDFQYYQNSEIMDVNDYLNTVYYLSDNSSGTTIIATGEDAELWNDETKVKKPETGASVKYNLNGYYDRVKKINEAIRPINQQLIGHNTDLVKKKAELEVAETTKEASTESIEQTKEEFLALTGVYPEEAQTGNITSISIDATNGNHGITSTEEWWYVDTDPVVDLTNTKVTTTVNISSYQQTCHAKITADQGTTVTALTGDGLKMSKSRDYTGIYLEEQWEDKRKYTLEYDVKVLTGDKCAALKYLGGHAECFSDYYYTITSGTYTKTGGQNANVIDVSDSAATNFHVKFTGTYQKPSADKIATDNQYSGRYDLWIQPNRSHNESDGNTIQCEISNIKLTKTITANEATKTYDRKANFYLNVKVGVGTDPNDNTKPERQITRTYSVSCTVPANATSATIEQGISSVDTSSSAVQKYIEQYTLYYEKLESSTAEVNRITPQIEALESTIKTKENRRKTLLGYKNELNKLFFKKYSRFILEGTWINEEYVDDDKYFADAQSVLYNSCYPQVAYNINVISLKGLPGYELIDFELGDKTYVIDEEFFGNDLQEEVIITEISESLDNPSQNTIKVQNFKNQFQDLFQKITATVQQTQYNASSYEKGAALVDANYKKQNEWITNAINNAESYLQYGQTVTTDNGGITIVDSSNKQNKLRLVGGAILFSVEKPDTNDTTWMTGITNQGISASLVTAGRLDTGAVQIMSGDKPVFRWDTYGISAYDAYWSSSGGINTISGINTKKFVRFDKNGIYGINNVQGIDGSVWHPSDNLTGKTALQQIDENATFALTWEGLKVTQGVATARIGNYSWKEGSGASETTKSAMIKINNGTKDTFIVDSSGNVMMQGSIFAKSGEIAGWTIDEGKLTTGTLGTNGFHMYASGYGSGKFFNADESKDWALGVGSNFGVDKDGVVYAKAGKIGTMEIGQLVGRAEQIVGKNLLKGSNEYREASAYALTPTTDDWYVYLNNLSVTLKANVTYTIACVTDGLWSGHVTSGSGRDRFCTLWLKDSKDNHTCFGGDTTETGYKSWTYTPTADDTYIIRVNTYGNGNSTVKFWDFKIEEGSIATPWCLSDEDAVQTNVNTNNFSWKFSPTEGMFMWNGAQPINPTNTKTKDAIFSIYNDPNEDGSSHYKLSMRGEIHAESGSIGGWTLNNKRLGSDTIALYTGEYENGFYGGKIALESAGMTRQITDIDYTNSKFITGGQVVVYQGSLPKTKGYLTVTCNYASPGNDYGNYLYDFEPMDLEDSIEHSVDSASIQCTKIETDPFEGKAYITLYYDSSGAGHQVGGQIKFSYKGYTKIPITSMELPRYFLAENGYVSMGLGRLGDFVFDAEGITIQKNPTVEYKITQTGFMKTTYTAQGGISTRSIKPWDSFF